MRSPLVILSNPSKWSIAYRLWFVSGAFLVAQLIGSAFNIWYNLSHIKPLLTAEQYTVFIRTILVYNLVVYPTGIFLWVRVVQSLHQAGQKLSAP